MDVAVRNIPPEVTQERIRLYFGNPKRGGPLEMKHFDKNSGCAVLTFKDVEDAEKVIQTKEFSFKKGQMLYASRVDQDDNESTGDTDEEYPVLLRGLPEDATEDLVYLFLEDLAEITQSHVTAVTLHKSKGSALVTLKEKVVAEMLLELDPEEIDGCLISFVAPSSEEEDSKEPVRRRKHDTENDSSDEEKNNNTKETSDVITTYIRPDDDGDSSPAKEEKQEDESKSNIQQLPQRKTPKPAPRPSRSKGASASLKEAQNDSDKESLSPTSKAAVRWSTKDSKETEDSQSSHETTPERERPPLRRKPEKAVRFGSEEKSEGETSPAVPFVRTKGSLVIPEGLKLQNIVPNLGPKPRVSKRFSVEESENKDESAEEQAELSPVENAPPVMQAMLPTNVFQQLKGRLKSTGDNAAEPEDTTAGSEVD